MVEVQRHREAGPGRAVRVMGIDPGVREVGYGVIDWVTATRRSQLVDYGVIHTSASLPLGRRLELIHRELGEHIRVHGPQVAAIEELYFAKNAKTAMMVAHGRAACMLAASGGGMEILEYTPLQIKQALTGSGRAGKQQVQAMVRVVLELAETPRPDHAADALAAALCHVHSMGLREKAERLRTEGHGVDGGALKPEKLRLVALGRRRRGRRRR